MRKWALAAALVALTAGPAGAEPVAWSRAIETLAQEVGSSPGGVKLRSLVVQDIREEEARALWPLSDMLATSLAESLARRSPGYKVLNAERAGTLGQGADGLVTGTFRRTPAGYRLSLQVQRLATRETLAVLPSVEVDGASLPAGAVPQGGFGRVVLDLAVQDARVFVDGEPVGAGAKVLTLPLGSHLVTVAKDGYEVFERTIHVRPEPTMLEASLRRKVLSARIEANVAGARVALDGKDLGLTPVSLADLSPGKHRLSVTKSGYRPYEADIDWQGKDQLIRAELALVPGSLVVSADVPDALISLDGEPRGKAPLLLSELGPGTHRLTALAPGYAPYEQEVRVVSAETLGVRARLMPDVRTTDDEGAFEAVALLPRTGSRADRALVAAVHRELAHAGAARMVSPEEAVRAQDRLMPEGWREDAAQQRKLALALKARRVVVLGVESFTPFERHFGVWPERPALSATMTTYRSSGHRDGDVRRFHRQGGEPWGFGTLAPGESELVSVLAPTLARELSDGSGPDVSAPGDPLRHEGFVQAGISRLDLGLGYAYRLLPMLDLGVGYRYFNAVGDDRTSGKRLAASGPGADLVYGLGQAHRMRLEALYRFDGLVPTRGPVYQGARWIPYLGAGYRLDVDRYEVYGVGRSESEGAFWEPRHQGVGIAGLRLNLGGVAYRCEAELPVVYRTGDLNGVRWTFGAGWLF